MYYMLKNYKSGGNTMIYDSKLKNKDVDGLFEAILLLENLEECYLSLIHI